MLLSVSWELVSVVRTYGHIVNPNIKKAVWTVVMKLSELSKKLERLLRQWLGFCHCSIYTWLWEMWCLSWWLWWNLDRHLGNSNWSTGVQAEHSFPLCELVPSQNSQATFWLYRGYAQIFLKTSRCYANRLPWRSACGYVQKGDKVVVIDGAVGQCAVIAAKMRGASQSSSWVATKTVNRWPWSQVRQLL